MAILGRLDHPQIIKLLEFFTDDSYLYIVMQYASKGDLHNVTDIQFRSSNAAESKDKASLNVIFGRWQNSY